MCILHNLIGCGRSPLIAHVTYGYWCDNFQTDCGVELTVKPDIVVSSVAMEKCMIHQNQ